MTENHMKAITLGLVAVACVVILVWSWWRRRKRD